MNFKLLTVLLFVFVFFGCKNNNVNSENTLIMEIEGMRYETQQVTTKVVRLGTLFSVDITATFPDRKDKIYIKIYSLSQQGAGSYNLGGLEQNQIAYAQDGNLNGTSALKTDISCIASQGNFVQITNFDDQYLNGNFSATICRNGTSKDIKNGQLIRLYVPF